MYKYIFINVDFIPKNHDVDSMFYIQLLDSGFIPCHLC